MKTAADIIRPDRSPSEIIEDLREKSVKVPEWENLRKEYDPKQHPVMKDPSYKDNVTPDGIEKVTRVPISMQKLAANRMTQLMFGIPVKRVYKTTSDREKEVAKVIEKILLKNRIDAMNIERGVMLFAGCEFVTLWYATDEENNQYGVESKIKIRSRSYSPMENHRLYPLFNEYDDLIALSFEYNHTEKGKTISYFDTYTKDQHIRYKKEDQDWTQDVAEENSLGKIPAIYLHRSEPIWEDNSNNVSEIEWTLSRNGNYIRRNAKPVFAIFADEDVQIGNEKVGGDRTVLRYPSNAKAGYVTWEQATDSIKMQIDNLYRIFFTQIQLPDMSFDQMKAIPMSGEARKMMFIDAHLKVTQEAGRWIEALDREINVIREFTKTIMPGYEKEIDTLEVETIITPYQIGDDSETIKNLTTATGGKAIMSQLDAIEYLGWTDDPNKTLAQIQKEETSNLFEPTE